jgi:hypothetical protein
MIDLLKNYKELRNAPGYVGSIRYYLAKKKLDVNQVIVRHSSLNGSARKPKQSHNSLRKHRKEN